MEDWEFAFSRVPQKSAVYELLKKLPAMGLSDYGTSNTYFR